MYPLVNKHSNGKSPFFGNTSTKGPNFPLLMLDYRSVHSMYKSLDLVEFADATRVLPMRMEKRKPTNPMRSQLGGSSHLVSG